MPAGLGHTQQETVTFARGTPESHVQIRGPLESTYEKGHARDASLASYLSRPVRIFNQTVAVGTMPTDTIDPWFDFLTDPGVASRTSGFRHLRGVLRIRITVTGNPMLYGRLCVCYQPRYRDDEHEIPNINSGARLVNATSLPHVFLDPSQSKGAEMTLPFFHPHAFLDLIEVNEVQRMGRLRLVPIVDTASANATTGSWSFSVMAWMEDVVLCTPTSQGPFSWVRQSDFGDNHPVKQAYLSSIYSNGTFQPQTVYDEFKEAPISKPAGAVAAAAGMLSRIPVIRPYALATEMVANKIKGIAQWFGFSRPNVVENPSRYREQWGGDMATVDTHEVTNNLGLSTKNQLTIDPATVGLPRTDEMDIRAVCSTKFVMFDRFIWAESDGLSQNLIRINVTPEHWNSDTSGSFNASVPTLTCGVAQLFDYWRGTLIFKFDIICSQFHRGKLRVIYDPVQPTTGNIGFNQAYSTIIDIAHAREVEIPITWNTGVSHLKIGDFDPGSVNFNMGPTINADPRRHNGQMLIEVLEPLQSPDDAVAPEVQVFVSVKGGDDLAFQVPSARITSEGFTYQNPQFQSGGFDDPALLEIYPMFGREVKQSDAMTDSADDGKPDEALSAGTMGAGMGPERDATDLVFFGETIRSLRSLLHRYVYFATNLTNIQFYPYRGANGVNPARNGPNLDQHEWIMCAYAGWRGSVRLKGISRSGGDTGQILQLTRAGTRSGGQDVLSFQGTHVNYKSAEVTLPFYSDGRFSEARGHDDVRGNLTDAYTKIVDPDNPNYQAVRLDGSDMRVYRAMGNDATCFFLVGFPMVYKSP